MEYKVFEQKKCPVTSEVFDTGNVIEHEMFGSLIKNEYICTGFRVSEVVQNKIDQGYVPLVGIDESKSEELTPQGVFRTGSLVYIDKNRVNGLLNSKVDLREHKLILIEQSILSTILKKINDGI